MSAPETQTADADALHVLAAELREEGPVIAPHVIDPEAPPVHGPLAACGPRCAARPSEYATVVEAVREGYLLHYGEPRLLPGLDPDLRLLIGDYLYARGIEQLAGLGDLLAVNELSDLISLAAQIDASARPSSAPAEAAWLASAVVIATGADAAHERAKATLRTSGDARPLWRTAEDTAARAGISESLAQAVDAVGFSPSHLG
ncbi:MAG: hypothetical protein M3Q53_04185 [Actinomycetota bacterium]|nr:hypothetical protein [Actinomycetota bacterium]